MDDTDRAILNEIQSDFPILPRPYRELGGRLGLSEEEVIARVRSLKENGIIRRIGGNFSSSKLDFTSTLCAARVPENRIEEFVKTVNRYPGVTHNYLRSNDYNIWFTFIAPDRDHIKKALEEISRATEVTDILNLPARRVFKIRVDFEV
ncbi:MAG: AsnC family transcriptional regulator [Deltaproteobacteria bacterium]|nr:AsnC family transcriptional regulator [Deltaproteobacteria bacterium]